MTSCKELKEGGSHKTKNTLDTILVHERKVDYDDIM